MLRKIIEINEELCDGCGDCEIGCSEGAIKVINGKAKLVRDEFCDGFGDCLKECVKGAIKITQKEAKPFDEAITRENLLKTKGYEAVWKMEESMLRHKKLEEVNEPSCACPGSKPQKITNNSKISENILNTPKLQNWPVQITLLPIKAPYYNNSDFLLAADCCAYTCSNFHQNYLAGKTLAIGCPKLDDVESYEIKLSNIFKENAIKSLTILFMEVPCCNGIVRAGENAVQKSGKDIPIKRIRLGINGNIIEER